MRNIKQLNGGANGSVVAFGYFINNGIPLPALISRMRRLYTGDSAPSGFFETLLGETSLRIFYRDDICFANKVWCQCRICDAVY